MANQLKVVVLKPSKYARDGYVERYRWGFMPNSTVPHLRSMTPPGLRGSPVEVHTVDEYVHTDLDYLKHLRGSPGRGTLVSVVGVQSHQLHRALDLAAYARRNGCMTVVGGPHPMTCDTSALPGRGVSFATAEAELVWPDILDDAAAGGLRPVYGQGRRWQPELDATVIVPPSEKDMRRYVIPMLGLYPARGCPFVCNYCSVIKIAGRRLRTQSVETTVRSLRAAKAAGIRMVMFVTDNFNKYAEAEDLLRAMIEERLGMSFFVQCDTQIVKQEGLVELLARAGCFEIFLGVESFDRDTLLAARKGHNRPELYSDIVELCRAHGIHSHFSNILGFPGDTAAGVERHVETLCELSPVEASFYVLCPIPGTEQYDEFLRDGLIFERNLDRFDGTVLTWKHPNLSAAELDSLLFRAYARFYSLKHVAGGIRRLRPGAGGRYAKALSMLGRAAFHRHCARRRTHPMSGGVKRVRLDSELDYAELRRTTFGFDYAPLPRSLQLSEEDQALNRLVSVSIKR